MGCGPSGPASAPQAQGEGASRLGHCIAQRNMRLLMGCDLVGPLGRDVHHITPLDRLLAGARPRPAVSHDVHRAGSGMRTRAPLRTRPCELRWSAWMGERQWRQQLIAPQRPHTSPKRQLRLVWRWPADFQAHWGAPGRARLVRSARGRRLRVPVTWCLTWSPRPKHGPLTRVLPPSPSDGRVLRPWRTRRPLAAPPRPHWTLAIPGWCSPAPTPTTAATAPGERPQRCRVWDPVPRARSRGARVGAAWQSNQRTVC